MFKKLKGLMYENDVGQKMLAKKLGKSQGYITARMNGKMPFTLDDVYAICEMLDIPLGEIHDYFPKKGRVRAS